MAETSDILDYASPRSGPGAIEQALYILVRILIALSAPPLLVGTIAIDVMEPQLRMERPGSPPPLGERLPGIVLTLSVGILLLVPHRWTHRPWLFRPRLVIYLLLAAYLLWLAGAGVLDGLRGGKSLMIYPVSMLIGCIGVSLPICLIWSRRMVRSH